MYSASQHVHLQHGGGAVILVASRNPGKRKRGSRSAAAVAARIERGYLKRTRTVGGTACVQSNHVYSRGTGADGSGHPAVERTSTAARAGGDDAHIRKRSPCTVSAELDRDDRHARSARAGQSSRHTGDRQARPVRPVDHRTSKS